MSLTQSLLSPPADHKAAWLLSFPNKSIDHPNPSLSMLHSHGAGSQVACPPGGSPSFSNAVCDTIAKANAGVKEFVPAVRQSNEHAIISKLKNIIAVQPDQTIVTTLDDVDLYSLPEVERFLETSWVRFDYDSSARSLTIVMTDPQHEYLSQHVQETFQPAMQELASTYDGTWVYYTNCSYRPKKRANGEVIPLPSTLTPDGWITDSTSGASLIIEIATSEDIKHAQRKMQTFFQDGSVVAGIILSTDASKKYGSPVNKDDWDWRRKFVDLDHWFMGERTLGPIDFAGHRWGGDNISDRDHLAWWRPPRRFSDNVPRPTECELNCFNAELAALWGDLVATHFPSQNIDLNIHSIPKFDINSFHRGLKDSLYRTAHRRYETAWFKANRSTNLQRMENEINITKRRNERVAAALRRLKRQKVDYESEQDGEEAGGGPNIHS